MAGSDDDAEKEFDPTERKLDEARQRGEIPRSTDLTTAAAQTGLVLALVTAGAWSADRLGRGLSLLWHDPARLGADILSGGQAAFAGRLLAGLALPLAPLFALPAALALASLLVQRAIVVTPDKLAPKLSRISPLSLARQKFGPDGLFEFAKSAAKLTLVSALLFRFLDSRLPQILATAALPERSGLALMVRLLIQFLTVAALIGGVIAALDYLWQIGAHRRRLRMTRQEMKDEHKESEGDPHLKQQRRQRGYDIATNRMLTEVPQADVVIVNPTHYAVALKWERLPGRAPICIAKGVDSIAAAIRERALAAGVPIHRDPPTARALHATLEPGHEIHPDHYRSVAAAIRFAERIRQRARR